MRNCLIAFILLIFLSRPAGAWMPYTHIYLAERALQEASSAGTVTVYQVDPIRGRRLAPIGVYHVHSEVLKAILTYRGEFHAGLIGPDAYPDVATGEFAIHQDNELEGHAGPESDDWLEVLWRRSRGPVGTRAAEKAFVAGFLQHAAGDMFSHDFINYYSGGEYRFDHHNALKHLAIESYISRMTPASDDPHFFDLSVEHVHDFIVDTLIHTPLLSGDGGRLSLLAWIQALHSSPLPLPGEIQQHIDAGLLRWPQISTDLARAMVFNRARTPDWDGADAAIKEYLAQLDTMISEDEMITMYEKFKSWLPPGGKGDLLWFRKLKHMDKGLAIAIIDKMVEKEPELTGLQAVLVDPTPIFDSIVGTKDPDPAYPDHPLTMAGLRHQMRMEPFQATFDVMRFRAAYNTSVACEISLLGPTELRRLASDLREKTGRGPLLGSIQPNLMLGYIHSLDGSHEWRTGVEGQPSIIFDDPSFHLIFMDNREP